jgi:hypothetical protein
MHRKTTPKVKSGHVQKKNRWQLAHDDYFRVEQHLPIIDRKRPGAGYRHLLRRQHIIDFISLLPDWDELSRGLDAIVLAPGEPDTSGWHTTGVVGVCAWDADLWRRWRPEFCDEHQDILDRLDVPRERGKGEVLCKWTEGTARAYQLVHILLHELGHHHDRITTKSMRVAARGEPYAEEYARRYEDRIWSEYIAAFGLD